MATGTKWRQRKLKITTKFYGRVIQHENRINSTNYSPGFVTYIASHCLFI